MALITEAIPKERRGRALGIWNTGAPLGSTIGPVLGGFLIESFGWKSIFLVVIIGSSIALFFVNLLVPKSEGRNEDGSSFDWVGATGLMILATSFLMAATTGSVIPFGSPLNILFWTFTAIGMMTLIFNAIRNPNPLVGPIEVTNPRLILPAVAVSFRMIAHGGASFLLVIYVTNVFQKTPAAVGTFLLFYSLAAMIGVPLGGWLADRWISRISGSFGLAFIVTGMLYLGFIQPQGNHFILLPGMILAGLGSGLCLVSFTKEAVASLGQEKVGLASGLYNMIRFTGASISSPILGLILANAYLRYPGGETAAGPYMLGFRVIAVTSVIGTLIAASIPSPTPIHRDNEERPVQQT
jgi:predicted MFS family arabinose efflux permease